MWIKNELIEAVCLRPHPKEAHDKYNWVLNTIEMNVSIGGDRDLLQEIIEYDWVVGRSSMALVFGLMAGKKVWSCIPPGGKPCSLPHKEIQQLNDNIL